MPRIVPLFLALGLLSCNGGASPGLTYLWSSDPRSLDPTLSTDVPTGEAATLLFDNLTQFDTEARLLPGLATSWSASPDGKTWTFHLRSGVTFHDGTALTAVTIQASIIRALHMGAAGARLWPLLPIDGAAAVADSGATSLRGLKITDDSTIVFTLHEPLNIFPKLLAMPVAAIVPATIAADFAQHPVGSGPWKFVSWSHDNSLILARNDHWYGGAAKFDTLHIRIIPEVFTQSAEYESGHLSVVEVPVGETGRWDSTHTKELQRRPAMRAVYVAMNTTRGALRDVRVRQAINHAVNVPAILAQVIQGRGILAAGSIPPGIDGYDSTRARYRYDPEKAKALLAEAGQSKGLKLQLWRSSRADFARVAQAIQADLEKVGITVEVVERDPATGRAAARKGDVDLFVADWWADYPDGENFTWPLFRSTNAGTGGNYAFLKDPALDKLLDQARTTTDSLQKITLLKSIDAKVFDEAPWLFLWFPVDVWAMRPEIQGWRIPAVVTGQRWTTVSPSKPDQ